MHRLGTTAGIRRVRAYRRLPPNPDLRSWTCPARRQWAREAPLGSSLQRLQAGRRSDQAHQSRLSQPTTVIGRMRRARAIGLPPACPRSLRCPGWPRGRFVPIHFSRVRPGAQAGSIRRLQGRQAARSSPIRPGVIRPGSFPPSLIRPNLIRPSPIYPSPIRSSPIRSSLIRPNPTRPTPIWPSLVS